MADNKVTLEFHAVGADKTAAEVKKVEAAQANLSLEEQLHTRITAKDLLTASERQVAEYDRMVAAGRKVAAQQAADFKPSFVASMKSMEDQVAVVKKAEAGMASYTAGATHAAASTRNSSQALYVFSQGFEDLQYGMRGVLNNIPQLIFSMGGGAGLAGAISLAAVGGNALYRMFEDTTPKVKETSDTIKEAAGNVGQVWVGALEKAHDAAARQIEITKLLGQEFFDLAKAQNAATLAAIDNAEKLGLIESAEAARQRREAELQIKLDEETTRVREAVKSSGADVARIENIQREGRATFELLQVREAALAAMKAANREEEMAEARRQQAFIMGPVARAESASYRAGAAGRENLSKGLESGVSELRDRVAKLQAEYEVAMAEFVNVNTKLTDTVDAGALDIQTARQNFAAENFSAQSKDLAEGLTKTFGEMQTSSATAAAAKEVIMQAAADGKISADETLRVSQALRTLVGSLQVGTAGMGQNVAALIQITTDLQATVRNQQSQINSLKMR